AAFVPALRKDENDEAAFSSALGAVHVAGHPVNWAAVFEGTGARYVDLPTYAFQRDKYWFEARERAVDVGRLGLERIEHPLLGGKVELPDGGVLFTGQLDLSSHPWLGDHRVFDTILLPGAALVELVLHAAAEVGIDGVREAVLEAPVVLVPGQPLRVLL